MFRLVAQNCLKRKRFYIFGILNRCNKCQVKGIIPGGGLRKLQGIKEEDYFSKQDHKIFKNIKENYGSTQLNNIACNPCKISSKKIPKPHHKLDHKCSIKHKNLLEESYFLNENCDSIQIMKSKITKEDES